MWATCSIPVSSAVTFELAGQVSIASACVPQASTDPPGVHQPVHAASWLTSTSLYDVQVYTAGLTPPIKTKWCLCCGADGMQYLRDTCLTLCCFLQAYPSGAQLLSQGQAGMVTQLSSLHDDLLPTLIKAVASAKQQPLAQQVHPLLSMEKGDSSTTHAVTCI